MAPLLQHTGTRKISTTIALHSGSHHLSSTTTTRRRRSSTERIDSTNNGRNRAPKRLSSSSVRSSIKGGRRRQEQQQRRRCRSSSLDLPHNPYNSDADTVSVAALSFLTEDAAGLSDDEDDDDEEDDDVAPCHNTAPYNDTTTVHTVHASPISVADMKEFCRPRRQRKVTFAQEPPKLHVIYKDNDDNTNNSNNHRSSGWYGENTSHSSSSSLPSRYDDGISSSTQQRLQGLTLAELDCGMTVPRSAFGNPKKLDDNATTCSDSMEFTVPTGSPSSSSLSTTKRILRRKVVRPIHVLEQRHSRVKRLLEEAHQELEEHKSERKVLSSDNKQLRKALRAQRNADSPEAVVESVLDSYKQKQRKYQKKITTLQKAKDSNEKECYRMVREMLDEPDLKKQLSAGQIKILQNIDKANRREEKKQQKRRRQRSSSTPLTTSRRNSPRRSSTHRKRRDAK